MIPADSTAPLTGQQLQSCCVCFWQGKTYGSSTKQSSQLKLSQSLRGWAITITACLHTVYTTASGAKIRTAYLEQRHPVGVLIKHAVFLVVFIDQPVVLQQAGHLVLVLRHGI